MGFRRIGVLADEVIRRVQETRAAADIGACPVKGDDLEKIVIREEDVADPKGPTKLPGSDGRSVADDTAERQPPTVCPGFEKHTRTADGWIVRPPRVRKDRSMRPHELAPLGIDRSLCMEGERGHSRSSPLI